jgi:hypothetical protein
MASMQKLKLLLNGWIKKCDIDRLLMPFMMMTSVAGKHSNYWSIA